MAWTPPLTWSPGDVVTASQMNTYVRDNPAFLLGGRQIAQKRWRNSGNYTTTSTAWVKVDSTNLTLSVNSTFASGRLFCTAQFWTAIVDLDSGATAPYFMFYDLLVDNTTYLSTGTSSSTYGCATLSRDATYTPTANTFMNFSGCFTGLSADVHTVDLVWKCGNANTRGTVLSSAYVPASLLIAEF